MNTFNDLRNDAGLDSDGARQMVLDMGRCDEACQTPLTRADGVLNRNIVFQRHESIPHVLAKFGNLAAFAVDARFRVCLCNAGAVHFFAIGQGTDLRTASLSPEAPDARDAALTNACTVDIGYQHLVKIEQEETRQRTVYQVRKLSPVTPAGDVLGLTPAKQGIARSRVERRGA